MRLIALLVAVVVGCVGMTACSGGQASEPIFSDPPSQTPAPSESATPEQESAQDFIRRWQKAGDEMQSTGDTANYRGLYLKSCSACEAFADQVDQIYAAGGEVRFPGTKVIAVKPRGGGQFYVRVDVPDTTVRQSKGAELEVLPGSSLTWDVQLRSSKDGWRVARYAQLAGSAQ